jgi:hypothetical protein
MKRFSLSVIGMIFWLTGIISANVLIAPNDTNINYYGRCDFSKSADSVGFNWPGTIIEATFPGPTIGVELRDGGAYFNVEIDGAMVDSLAPSTTTNTRMISTSLSTGNHTIRLTLRTNGQTCSFRGFYLANGSILAPHPVMPTRKIEYIGDSWTAGDNIFAPVGSAEALNTFDAEVTYARVTSKAFYAQDHLTARGGCGLVKSQGGAAVMATRFPETECDLATPLWNFTSWTPALVTMCLGINDFGLGVADSTFIAAYKTLITTVRGKYPNVPIILIGLSAQISGQTAKNTLLADVKTIAQSFTGITVFSSPITTANAAELYQHPSQAQHKLIADSLIPVVMQVMGWDTTATTGVDVHRCKQVSHFAAGSIMKVSQDNIVLPFQLSGWAKEVAVYDFSGRAIRKITTAKQTISLKKDLGLPSGIYLVKTTGIVKNN